MLENEKKNNEKKYRSDYYYTILMKNFCILSEIHKIIASLKKYLYDYFFSTEIYGKMWTKYLGIFTCIYVQKKSHVLHFALVLKFLLSWMLDLRIFSYVSLVKK